MEFDLREVVEDSVRSLARRAQQNGLELACEIAPILRRWWWAIPAGCARC